MAGSNARRSRAWRRGIGLALAVGPALWSTAGAQAPAAPVAAAAAAAEVQNSALDAPLFYQLLIGELELRGGEAGTAYQVLLDAARRTKDEALFRRATEVALSARAGDQALAAAKAWRQAVPGSADALRYQIQILLALNRLNEAADPLRELIASAPAADRPGMIAGLSRLLQRAPDRKQAAEVTEQVLAGWRDGADTRVPVRVVAGRAWLAAGDAPRALALAREAQALDADAPGPALLALEMLPATTEAERIVVEHLARPKAAPELRLAYVRALTQAQRLTDAAAQLEIITRDQPTMPAPWLSLGALRLDLKQPREAEQALTRFLELVQNAPPAASRSSAGGNDDDDDDADNAADDRGRTQAWLLLAQAAEQRNDLKAAEGWLGKVDNPQRAAEVQARRATLLARQGKIREARELIQRVPERRTEDARAKLLAEAQMLREVKRWKEATQVMASANQRFADDADLLYEQAMLEDKLERHDEMERLLRRVIALKPDHAHAHNALGYSLADRNLRLPEARKLIERALELTPGDPFITDSLGWVEYRMGNRDAAIKLLRLAYSARPDTEIAAHLGEVLWAAGQRDEARRVWQEARSRDASNEVLRDTLARLKVNL
jgi:tetratricopeptide (TPR) repeat protein